MSNKPNPPMPRLESNPEREKDADYRVIHALCALYSASVAGTRADASRDFIVDIKKLLSEADCLDGDARAEAEGQLRSQDGSLLWLEGLRRDPSIIYRVRVTRNQEAELFAAVGLSAPSGHRHAAAEQFTRAAALPIAPQWQASWSNWCKSKAQDVLEGKPVSPFDRNASTENEEILTLVPNLLSWTGESLVRFVSCVLCKDSKRLEGLAAREKGGEHEGQLRGKLGRILEEVTGGQVKCLNDLGILHNPRSVLLHGPLVLEFSEGRLDLNLLESPIRLGLLDVKRAHAISSTAGKCLTVENETTFHELAKLHSGVLLICTSYPGRATLALMERLSPEMQFWHFGDSDEAGFDILRVLRERTERDIQPLHMERGRVPFEQEALGRPTLANWPFYKLNRE